MMNNKSNALWLRTHGCHALIFKVEETTCHEGTVGGQTYHLRADTTVTMTHHHISCSVSITDPFIPKDSASNKRKYVTHSWEELSVSVFFFLLFTAQREREREWVYLQQRVVNEVKRCGLWLKEYLSMGGALGKRLFSASVKNKTSRITFFFKVPHCSFTRERFHIRHRPWQMVLPESLERPLKFFSQSSFCLSSITNIPVSMFPEIEMDIIIHVVNGHFIQSFF